MRNRHSLATILTACAVSLIAVGSAAAAPRVGTFQKRAPSPKPVNNLVVDPSTNMIYAQQYNGTAFYRYDPKTNKWTKLAKSPIPQGDNGGAAYLDGKIYTAYTEDGTVMGVYDIATGKWSLTANPLEFDGTGDITAVGKLLYLVEYKTLVSYNPATHKRRRLADPPFDFSPWGGLAPYKGMIYGDSGDGSGDFGAYDIATNTWTELPGVPDGAVLGAAIDPVTGTFYTYGDYHGDNFYRYDIATGAWLSTLTFPYTNLNDGGMAYVSAEGLQGIYATYGQGSKGFTRYVTKPHH